MAATAGSISVGVTLDAGNVMDDLVTEVEKAMKNVFSTVEVKMADINKALNKIDSQAMADKMAADNKRMADAISKATAATDKLGDSAEQTGKKTKDAAGKSSEGAAANKKLGDTASDAASKTEKLGGAVNKASGFLKGYGGIIAGVAGLGGIGTVLTKGLDRLTAIDNAKAKLSGLGHEAGTVQQIMDNAMNSVKGTAYGLGDAASVAAGAVAAGIKPGAELERTLKVIGDSASIAGVELGDMGAIFNKVAASNKIQGDVIAQLSDAGIPVVQLLGKELGKTSEEVLALASEGKINFETFQNAMEKGMGGAALKAGDTFKGAVDNAGAALGRLGATILDAPFKAAPGIIGGITETIDVLNLKTKGFLELLTTGSFGEAWEKAFPGKNLDNSPMAKFLVDVNDGVHMVKGALDLLRSGDYTKEIGSALGVDEDSKVVDNILRVREIALDSFGRIGAIFGQLRDGAMALVTPLGTIIGSLGAASAAIGFSAWDLFLTILEALTPLIVNTLVPAIETLANLMAENQTTVTLLVGAYTGYKTVMMGMTVAQNAWTVATKAWTAATKIGTAVMKVFNTVMKMSTFGKIVTAITLVVGALTWFFTQTELGKSIFEGLKNAIGVAWDWIVEKFNWAKEILAGVWQSISDAFSWTWENILRPIWDGFTSALQVIGDAFTWFYENIIKPVWDGIAAYIGFVWNNVIQPIFKVWETVIMGIIVPLLLFFFNQVIVPVFQGIGAFIAATWNSVIRPIWDAMKAALGWLGDAFNWVWNNVIKPAWDGLGAGISWVWENVIRPVWDGIKWGLEGLGAIFSWVWENVIRPVWDGLGAGISWVWENVIKPAWDAMETGLKWIGDFFSKTVKGIEDVWNKLRNILAKPINFMIGTVYNNGIAKAWNKVAEFIPGLVKAPTMDLIPEYATGGAIRGPGSGTSDDIFAKLSNGEHVVTAEEVRRAGGQSAVYAIRDMLFRGIPFSWDGGRVLSQLGQNNVSSYGAAVKEKGLGRVDPQGLFDQFLPRYATGGAVMGPSVIEPWMYQLLEGHKFAKSQHGKPYQWAGPRFVGDSFDCSGFMSSIAAAITGGNVWQRYWYTGSFGRGQGPGGPQGFVPGVDAGFSIGVTDDPGGPGGGHTAGTLGAIPALGIHSPVNVESGGSIGDVHYGGGPSPMSFLGQYHLPIGANGFFEAGSGSSGPSPEEQKSWLARKAMDVLRLITDPIANTIEGIVGAPPPEFLGIPRKFLDTGVEAVGTGIDKTIDGLGGLLSSAWAGAQNKVGDILGALNPFDSGGIANGVGFMPKNVIAPERVLSPEQTMMFEQLVNALTTLASGRFNAGVRRATGLEEDSAIVDAALSMREATDAINTLVQTGDYTGTLNRFGIPEDHPLVGAVLGIRESLGLTNTAVKQVSAAVETAPPVITEQGEVLAEKIDGTTAAVKEGNEDQRTEFAKLVDAWAVENIAGPLERAMTSAIGSDEARKLALGLVDGLGTKVDDAFTAAGDAIIKGITDTIVGTVETFITAGIDAAFGKNDGPFESWVMNAWAKMVDADIVARELLTNMVKEVRGFRGDVTKGFAVTGEIMSDTAMYMDRTATSSAISKQVQIDAMNEMMRATIQFVLTKILFPALSALLTALITAGLTAVGAAIGGPIGAAIGGGIGAAIGGVLSGLLGNAMGGVFDEGGLAHGVGMMPKATIQPERVLSPRQTAAFERLVDALDRGGLDRRSIHAPIYVQGSSAPEKIQDRLIGGLN
ncbi:tail length tape measure protein [Rhodococcus phage ReqiPine5]|uniref:Tape measure protein n=1 Tax=Rhodococcus phage ReqiPine5 TaxID=691963 RepID=D4P802_9CAUD|nr:tail length tape measure protein [Rhodococcus phage ReqiPine5]ADD81132.1 tape measure protein [Rhodococcus phage ReqiPine5]